MKRCSSTCRPHADLWAGIDRPGQQTLGMRASRQRAALSSEHESLYIYHFDGNASIARLLVRRLIPGIAPGSTMEDIVLARFDYGQPIEPSIRCELPT